SGAAAGPPTSTRFARRPPARRSSPSAPLLRPEREDVAEEPPAEPDETACEVANLELVEAGEQRSQVALGVDVEVRGVAGEVGLAAGEEEEAVLQAVDVGN